MTALAVLNTGFVTSVGLSSPATCAAIRAGLTNPCDTEFLDSRRRPIIGHRVPIGQPTRAQDRLVNMAALAIDECLAGVPRVDWAQIPLFLCVAERDRPGRMPGFDEQLFSDIQQELAV